MKDERLTPEGLPRIRNWKSLTAAIIADVETSRDREFEAFSDEIIPRIAKENPGYLSAVKTLLQRQYGKELEGKEAEEAITSFIFGYELLRRQAEANKLEENL